MTEIERILTTTLTSLEEELRQAQSAKAQTFARQDQAMIAHAEALRHLQQQVNHLNMQQQESTRQLQRLSTICEDLKPLLKNLSKILNAKI